REEKLAERSPPASGADSALLRRANAGPASNRSRREWPDPAAPPGALLESGSDADTDRGPLPASTSGNTAGSTSTGVGVDSAGGGAGFAAGISMRPSGGRLLSIAATAAPTGRRVGRARAGTRP